MMLKSNRIGSALIVVAVILILLLIWIVPSYFEARAYENVTGRKVSTWDAMWIELRVQASPEGE